MRRMLPNTMPMKFLLLAAILIPCGAWAAQTIVSNKQMREDAAGFKEFSDRVQEYVQLHNSVEADLRRVKRADSPEKINAHQQELAMGIREARPRARRGDIFKPNASEAIRHAIRSVFQSAQADPARATIQQGAPRKDSHLEVNQLFPEAVPYTTVPPTLLLKLPHLPDELAYRIVGRDLILLDVTAGLVVDFMLKAVPLESHAE
jgi:hypothetical protein